MKGHRFHRLSIVVRGIGWTAAVLTLLSFFLLSPVVQYTAAQDGDDDDGSMSVQSIPGCGGWLDYGDSRSDSIANPNVTCSYSFSAQAGDVVTIAMNRQTSTLDPYLELRDSNGAAVVIDDDGGGDNNSLIAGYRLAQRGRYLVLAYSYNHESTGSYVVTLSKLTADNCGGRLGVGTTLMGYLQVGSSCQYDFQGQNGQVITVALNAFDQQRSGLDPFLVLINPRGAGVASDDDSGEDVNSLITSFRLNQKGLWTISAESFNNGSGGPFILSLR